VVDDDNSSRLPARWLSVKEAADYLGMGQSTLYRLIAMGAVPHRVTPGTGVRRFTAADIAEIEKMAYRPPLPLGTARRRRKAP
jgi:excisionase family DNA binding protein